MKTLMTLFALLVSFTLQNAQASNDNTADITAYLQHQAELDLAGKNSCFKQAVLKKSHQMEEDYGGRYNPNVEIQVAQTDATVYRYDSKYCTEPVNGQRVCRYSDEFGYVAAARFSSATSGTFETEAIVFNVKKTVHVVLIVNDSVTNPEEDEIISRKVTTTYSCAPVSF